MSKPPTIAKAAVIRFCSKTNKREKIIQIAFSRQPIIFSFFLYSFFSFFYLSLFASRLFNLFRAKRNRYCRKIRRHFLTSACKMPGTGVFSTLFNIKQLMARSLPINFADVLLESAKMEVI